MRETGNLHQKVQELCDCFATADPLKEMSDISQEKETEEAALKWLALAVLHGINSNAKKIALSKDGDGAVQVTATYRKSELPNPGSAIGDKIIRAIQEITHLDSAKGSTTLAFGFRNNSMDLQVSSKEKKGEKEVTINFP